MPPSLNSKPAGHLATIIGLTAAAVLILIAYGSVAFDKFGVTHQRWQQFTSESARAASALNRLRSELGYGGYIHHFKNYVLRKDPALLPIIQMHEKRAFSALAEFHELDISPAEHQALATIERVFQQYVENLKLAEQLAAQGLNSNAIDDRVRIDDTPALEAFSLLATGSLKASHAQSAEIDAAMTAAFVFLTWGALLVPLFILIAVVITRFLRRLIEANQLIERARGELDDLINATPDGIICVDVNGGILRANNGAAILFGYSNDEFLEMTIEQLLPPRYRKSHAGFLQSYFAAPKVRLMGEGNPLLALRRDGREFPVEISLSSYRRNNELIVTASIRDITERMKFHKLQDEFVSVVSHELRTPITSIKGALSLLTHAGNKLNAETEANMLQIAKRNSDRLSTLVNDLLDMEKLVSGKMQFSLENCDSLPLIKQAVEECEPYAMQHRVSFVTSQCVNYRVHTDQQRVLQVLSNLLSNAAKFSRDEGLVEIECEPLDASLSISILDRGPGIPEEMRKQIFDRFTQVDASDSRAKGGTGLGLNICKALVENMGGAIDVYTREGGGSCFRFTLPLASPA